MDFIEIRPEGYRFQVSHLPNITPQLQAIVDRLTQRRIGDRYATAQELATALKSIR
jgi:serine/threonine-protein kinase